MLIYRFLIRDSEGNMILSPKAINVLEQGGGAMAFMSALGGFFSANHELVWGLGVTIGSIAAIVGIHLNLKRHAVEKQAEERAKSAEKRAIAEHVLKMKKLRKDID